MTSVVVESIIMLAAIIVTVFVVVQLIATSHDLSSSITSMSMLLTETLQSQVRIVTGYVSDYEITLWVKNVGKKSYGLNEIAQFDIIAGPRGNITYVVLCNITNSTPCWTYEIENDVYDCGVWNHGETLKIRILYSSQLPEGEYLVIVATPEGIQGRIVLSK